MPKPDHITITVDENALRAQVQKVVEEELVAASWALRRAADQLDPAFLENHRKWQEEETTRRAEAEHSLQAAANLPANESEAIDG